MSFLDISSPKTGCSDSIDKLSFISKKRDQRAVELEAEKEMLLERNRELESFTSVSAKELNRLRRKVDKYRKQKAVRQEEFMKDVEDLENAAVLVTNRDKELQLKCEELKKREARCKERLLLAETSELLNVERMNSLSEDWIRLQTDVSKTMIDKKELELLQIKLKSDFVPLSQYNEALTATEEVRNCFQHSCSKLQLDLESAIEDRKLVEDSLSILLEEKDKTLHEYQETNTKMLEFKRKAEQCERELNESRMSCKQFEDQMRETADVLVHIKEIANVNLPKMNICKTTEDLLSQNVHKSESMHQTLLLAQVSNLKLQLRQERKSKSDIVEKLKVLQGNLDEALAYRDSGIHELEEKNLELLEWKSNCFELEKKILDQEKEIKQLKEEMSCQNVRANHKKSISNNLDAPDETLANVHTNPVSAKKVVSFNTKEGALQKPVNQPTCAGSITHVSILNDFMVYISKKNCLTVVDFSAKWCAPCQAMRESFDALSRKFPKVVFLVVDNDGRDGEKIFGREKVSSMPTILMYTNGAVVHRMDGFDEAVLRKKINTFSSQIAREFSARKKRSIMKSDWK